MRRALVLTVFAATGAAACTSGGGGDATPTSVAPTGSTTTLAAPSTTREPSPPPPTLPRPPGVTAATHPPGACTPAVLGRVYDRAVEATPDMDFAELVCQGDHAVFVMPSGAVVLFRRQGEEWLYLGEESVHPEQLCQDEGAPASLCAKAPGAE